MLTFTLPDGTKRIFPESNDDVHTKVIVLFYNADGWNFHWEDTTATLARGVGYDSACRFNGGKVNGNQIEFDTPEGKYTLTWGDK